ncbi:ATP-binding protein [Bacteroides sp. 51]|uniref:hybrid sensor histidine kinase/response regulator n=1 Tax=Bacteroides sp. 51 TaxID=2302938 RepID=UPI0013D52B43|nr:ATP-binding protein [Bacteroides sp. 51]NDV83774.1 response regulator [Bacteroides sp. 51]
MSTPSRFTQIKIAIGYLLLLGVLFVALWLIHREVENLSVLDTEQILKADSLHVLLKEKDENTLDILRSLNEVNDKLLSVDELEEIISKQDSVITQQRVQHRVVIKTDSVVAPVRKKGFLKRIGEVFSPSKDTAVVVNTTQELTTDTLLHEINPVDSLHQRIRTATEQKREINRTTIQRNTYRIRKQNKVLTARIDSLIKGYEEEAVSLARREAENQQSIRQRSTRIIGGIAIGAVLLAAFFLILIWRDITRSNRYRRKLEEANRLAEELLQARENLMLTITHDFKAPLGSIIGYIDLMSQLSVDNRQKFYLDNMKGSSSHLLKLVNDLLDFHRLDLNKVEINRVTFNPAQLFDEIHTSFQPLTDAKNLSLRYEMAPELNARFISDPLRIRQIVNNLLSNAVKFTVTGSVTLKVGYEQSRLQIIISDTGKGMAPADKERIFQEFTRLPGAQGEEGFGLGLSIVAKLVNLLEGTIEVESTEGEGSSFIVSLPLFPVGGKGKRASKPEQTEQEEASVKPARVLLIDDDKIQLNLTSAMLERAGIAAVCCEQLEELTEYLRREQFDVLLTDVQMPAINGFDLLSLLRASNIPQARTIPIIAVTARSEMREEDFLNHGFAGCLNKPFSISALLAAIGGGTAEAESSSPQDMADETATQTLNLAALTAFSEGDESAARSIIESFIAETTKNAETLREALNAEDVEQIAGMAHKLLPIFTLLQATEIIPLLSWLEEQRGEAFSSEIKGETERVLRLVYEVVRQVQTEL